jgi:hypothetical protein
MPFILGSELQNDGTVLVQYDDGPARRIQLVTLAEHAHTVTAIPPEELFKYTLATERPPARNQEGL